MTFIRSRDWDLDVVRKAFAEELQNLRVEPRFRVPPGEGEKCRHCFCTPCITNERNRQEWWKQQDGEGAAGNNSLRKSAYYKFWTMMYHRGIWSLPEYVIKKDNAVRRLRAENRNDQPVRIQREIMPHCVLELVRNWYPNLPNMPYMGHKWA